MEYLAKDNVQLSTLWAQGTRALPADALAVQFARTVEDRLAALEGPQASQFESYRITTSPSPPPFQHSPVLPLLCRLFANG